MKHNKHIASVVSLIMLVLIFTSCYAKVVVLQEAPKSVPVPVQKREVAVDGSSLKTGLYFVASTTGSKDSESDDGIAQSDVSLVAVAVDENGVIDSCIIDSVQANIDFNNSGVITTDLTSPVLTKNELGPLYGMAKVSPIGKEWNEQVSYLASYVVGKTADEVKGIAFSKGKPEDVDLASSVTIYIGGYIDAIVNAVENAEYRGGKKGDRLELAVSSSLSSSKSASDSINGLAQIDTNVMVLTLDGDTITSSYIDAVQAKVAFDSKGKIVGELESSVSTKNELKEKYGMSMVSSIGKDWYQQAQSYTDYIAGKTLDEALGISVNERTVPTEADLSSSVTMAIGDFQSLLSKIDK